MKYIGYAAIFLFLNLSCNFKIKNCKRFQKGTFMQFSRDENALYIIERNASIQIEKNQSNGNIVTSKIIWLNACKCELLFLSRNFAGQDSLLDFVKEHPLKVEIIEARKQYCVFKAYIEGSDKTVIDTMRIFKN